MRNRQPCIAIRCTGDPLANSRGYDACAFSRAVSDACAGGHPASRRHHHARAIAVSDAYPGPVTHAQPACTNA